MVNLKKLIQVHENSLSHELCDELIDYFNSNENNHERLDNDGYPNFTQLNLTRNIKQCESLHNTLIKKTLEYKEKYYEYVSKEVFPKSHGFEEIRIKKYNVGGNDRFDTHVDVTDYNSSRRFLSFFWYLNDVDRGGETEFIDISITPKKGSLVIFPPLWMFPHKGNSPISGEKYLLSTYLHYL